VLRNDFYGLLFGGNSDAVLSLSGVYSSFVYPNAHNAWLNQLVYFGIFGFLFFSVFMLRSLFAISGVLRGTGVNGPWELRGVWAGMVVVFGYAFFEPMHQGVANLGIFMLLCGISHSRWVSHFRSRPGGHHSAIVSSA
jgi:hypothetical protein